MSNHLINCQVAWLSAVLGLIFSVYLQLIVGQSLVVEILLVYFLSMVSQALVFEMELWVALTCSCMAFGKKGRRIK